MFKTFPEFSKLTLADKDAYNELIKDFPPIADLSFACLMSWWNMLDSSAIAELNGNLVISYWLPGDDENSGLSIAGTNMIDETICEIFDTLTSKGERPRLVHVPSFVIDKIKYPEMFKYATESHYDDVILPVSSFYPLKDLPKRRVAMIERFIKNNDDVSLRAIDLSNPDKQKMLLSVSDSWQEKGTMTYIAGVEREIIPVVINNATKWGVYNYCLFVGDELCGFYLYELPSNSEYAIATFMRADTAVSGSCQYLHYSVAQRLTHMGVRYINSEQDLGLQELRAEKLSFRPMNYFRKYTVEPYQM